MPARLLGGAVTVFAVGCAVGAAFSGRGPAELSGRALAQPTAQATPPTIGTLAADVAILKDKATDQAHVMASVEYHFSHLWFAGQAENWPLAQFYWNETRSHLRWAVRVIPVRKDNAGKDVHLAPILEAFENTPLKQLQDAITAQDRERFVKEYKFTLETCYACHKTSDKPYLRPKVPERAGDTMINFDPQATWPQ
jgi:hypothetical protein